MGAATDFVKLILVVGLVLAIIGGGIWIISNWDSLVSDDDDPPASTSTTTTEPLSVRCEFVAGRGYVMRGTLEPCDVLASSTTAAVTDATTTTTTTVATTTTATTTTVPAG